MVVEPSRLGAAAVRLDASRAVGTLVLDVTKRHAALAAKSSATIASLAEGRLAIGIGAGGDAAEPISEIRLRQYRCYDSVTRAPAPRKPHHEIAPV